MSSAEKLSPPSGRQPIPVSVLTGFLGAGKTSLLNRLVKDPALEKAAFVINEFGDIGLDHLLVEAGDDGIVELSSGCLCCTIRGDLVATLEGFLRRLDNGRLDRLSRVVIETTGLADPAPVLHTIMAHPYFLMRYRLDGVVTVVDAVNGAATLDAHEEAVKQAAVADRLVLTKTDLAAGAARAQSLKARLRALNPAAPILEPAKDVMSVATFFNAGLYDPAAKIPDVGRWLNAEAYGGHDHSHHHNHDRNRHDAHIRSFALATDRPVPAARLEMFLDLLRSAHGAKLLRMKGVVRLQEDPERPLVLHGVQEIFHPPVKLQAWPDADHRTRLVLITRDLDEAFVRRLFDAFVGTLAPDTADAGALSANPMQLSGFTPPSHRT